VIKRVCVEIGGRFLYVKPCSVRYITRKKERYIFSYQMKLLVRIFHMWQFCALIWKFFILLFNF